MDVRALALPSAAGGADGVAAHWVGFDPATFDPDDYGREGVVRPASIAASVVGRQAAFLHGRRAARAGLVALGRAAPPIGIGDHGEPCWPDGIVGSISHTSRLAAAAVAPRDRFACVGLDLAAFVTASGERAILERTLGPSERAFLQADRDGPALRFALTVAFSAKESLFKALFPHVGCRFGFDAACVTDYAPAAGTIGLALTRSLAPRLPAGQPFTLAFATCAPSTVLTCMFVDRLGG